MKLISLMFLLIFSITSYAQEESVSQTESQWQTESTPYSGPMQKKAKKEKTGFFSVSIGGEVIPVDNFVIDAIVSSITYGGILSKQSSFEAGIKLVDNGGLLFRYGYSFTKDRQWVPGMDVTLLISAAYGGSNDSWKLKGGFELGPYLKTFISRSHSLFVRTGIAHYATIGDDFDIAKFRIYLNLGVKWHF